MTHIFCDLSYYVFIEIYISLSTIPSRFDLLSMGIFLNIFHHLEKVSTEIGNAFDCMKARRERERLISSSLWFFAASAEDREKRQADDPDAFLQGICAGKGPGEWFRLELKDCRDVYQCTEGVSENNLLFWSRSNRNKVLLLDRGKRFPCLCNVM